LRLARLSNGVSNFYVVEQRGRITVVDAGTPRDWKQLLLALDSIGCSAGDIEAVLLTHAHSDHTGFAEKARTDADAVVWVHEKDAEVARGGRRQSTEGGTLKHLKSREAHHTLFGLLLMGGVRVIPIKQLCTFDDGETLDLPGSPKVVHTPGHTLGSSSVLFERPGWLMTGDALVTLNPMTGRRGPQIMPSALNHDSTQALASLRTIDGIGARAIFPGHGAPLRASLSDAVEDAWSAGRS